MQRTPSQEETIPESDTDSQPGDALFDNKYTKYTLEEIKISSNEFSASEDEAISPVVHF